nr:type VI secretion system tube protein TssD [Labilibaculum sp.]
MDQKTNTYGTASTQPLGGLFNIEVESPKNTHLYAWGASNLEMKYVKLEFSPVTLASKSRTIELYDTLCIRHHDYFHHESKDPMISVLQLSPAIIVQDGQTLVEKNWKVSDLSMQNVEPTQLVSENPEILECFFENEQGEALAKPKKNQTIYLVVKTRDMVGKSVDLDLSDDSIDYEYNGAIVDNDLIQGVNVTADIMKIQLKTIKQRRS